MPVDLSYKLIQNGLSVISKLSLAEVWGLGSLMSKRKKMNFLKFLVLKNETDTTNPLLSCCVPDQELVELVLVLHCLGHEGCPGEKNGVMVVKKCTMSHKPHRYFFLQYIHARQTYS